jgi:hypothetical protein
VNHIKDGIERHQCISPPERPPSTTPSTTDCTFHTQDEDEKESREGLYGQILILPADLSWFIAQEMMALRMDRFYRPRWPPSPLQQTLAMHGPQGPRTQHYLHLELRHCALNFATGRESLQPSTHVGYARSSAKVSIQSLSADAVACANKRSYSLRKSVALVCRSRSCS